MFQLRYLIASDRRLSPVRFTHRSHRFKGTAPDEFHTGHKTFICADYHEFRDIFEHEVRHNPAAKIVPLIELHNPATGERRHLDGTEQVLTADILEALAPEESEPSERSADTSVVETHPVPQSQMPASDSQPSPTTENATESPSTTANEASSPPASLADRIKPLVAEKKRTVTDLANELGVAKDVVTVAAKTEGSGLTYASGWVGLTD